MLHKCMPGVLIRGLCMLPVGLAPVSQPCSSLLCTLVAGGGHINPSDVMVVVVCLDPPEEKLLLRPNISSPICTLI